MDLAHKKARNLTKNRTGFIGMSGKSVIKVYLSVIYIHLLCHKLSIFAK